MTKKISTPIAILIILILAIGVGTLALCGKKDYFKVSDTVTKAPSIVVIPDKIIILSPKPDEKITNPVIVKGKARGFWFFEASFPVKIYDYNGNLLAQWYATFVPDANYDSWMTTDFINFEGKIEYLQPTTEKGYIVFQRDNPADLPQFEEMFNVPIRFK